MYLCFNINFVKIVNCTFSITEKKKNKNSETILIVSIEELIEEENIK